MTNIADKQQVEESEKRLKFNLQQEERDFVDIMKTPHGRRFIHGLIGFCGVFKSSYTGNSATFYNEGQRNVGLMIMSKINEHCPELYVTMINEHRQNEKGKRNG